jgi:very-short-patch-repair endonuclease
MPVSPDIIAIVIVAALVVIGLIARILRNHEPAFPYVPAEALLTEAETAFFASLQLAVGEDFVLFSKVRLADVIEVRPGLVRKFRMRAFNRICGKHLDFVICDPESFTVLGAIELDDKSHQQSNRRERDTFIDKALSAAGIPILHMPAQRRYSALKLRSQVLDFLESDGPTLADRHS